MKLKLNKDKLNKAIQGILIVLIIFTVGFIWSNSLKPVVESDKQAHSVANQINKITTQNNTVEQPEIVTDILRNIRKTAHLVEFLTLGIEISLLSISIRRKISCQSMWNIISTGVMISVIDESLQIISHRGPVVKDILIDSLGLFIGIFCFLLVFCIIKIINSIKKARAT